MPRKKIPPAVIEAAYQYNAFKPRVIERSDRSEGKKGFSRVMYVENKTDGAARIGRVTFSKSRSTLYYRGRAFRSLKGDGFKANFFEIGTGEFFWISGPKKDGADRLYGERVPVEIDDDVRDEYWREIRNHPERSRDKLA